MRELASFSSIGSIHKVLRLKNMPTVLPEFHGFLRQLFEESLELREQLL